MFTVRKYRLCREALSYSFAYRPLDDGPLKEKRRRELEEARIKGLRGAPISSEHRNIAKLFDFQRKKATKYADACKGCDLDHQRRGMHMRVGSVQAGGLKS